MKVKLTAAIVLLLLTSSSAVGAQTVRFWQEEMSATERLIFVGAFFGGYMEAVLEVETYGDVLYEDEIPNLRRRYDLDQMIEHFESFVDAEWSDRPYSDLTDALMSFVFAEEVD